MEVVIRLLLLAFVISVIVLWTILSTVRFITIIIIIVIIIIIIYLSDGTKHALTSTCADEQVPPAGSLCTLVAVRVCLPIVARLLEARHSCHILPFQPTLWNSYFPSEPVKPAKNSPPSISEGGRLWQVCTPFQGVFGSQQTYRSMVLVRWTCERVRRDYISTSIVTTISSLSLLFTSIITIIYTDTTNMIMIDVIMIILIIEGLRTSSRNHNKR